MFPEPKLNKLEPPNRNRILYFTLKTQFKLIKFMKEAFEGDHSLYYGADDEQESYITRGLSEAELLNRERSVLERYLKVKDKNGKKQVSASTFIDMINDVSQQLKIGFEQSIKAKEDEIRKLKKELAAEKSTSDEVNKENQMLVQDLDKAQAGNRQLAQKLDKVQSEKQQLAHDLGEAQTKNKELARGQGEAMAECSMLEYKLEEAQAENQKLSKKLDEARDEISCKDIAIRRMRKDAERKDTAMQVDVSEVKEAFAREMIDSGIRFVKDMKTAIDDSQTFKCMGLLTRMTDDCFGKHEAIHSELKDMIQGIFDSREQVAKEQNEPRPNNVTVEKGGVYNAEVHHQNIHPKVDKRDFLPEADLPGSLPEADLMDSLPRYKRRRFRLEGEDYEWK